MVRVAGDKLVGPLDLFLLKYVVMRARCERLEGNKLARRSGVNSDKQGLLGMVE